jgi:hypothetical protein
MLLEKAGDLRDRDLRRNCHDGTRHDVGSGQYGKLLLKGKRSRMRINGRRQ